MKKRNIKWDFLLNLYYDNNIELFNYQINDMDEEDMSVK